MMKRLTINASLVTIVLGVITGLMFFASLRAWAGTTQQHRDEVVIYFFWGDGCPHCTAAKPFLAALAERYPTVVVRDYEVWRDEENQRLFMRMAAKFGFEPTGVPTFFIGERYWVGYAPEPVGQQIAAYVAACTTSGCSDAGSGVITPLPTSQSTEEPAPPESKDTSSDTAPVATGDKAGALGMITLPLLGMVDLSNHSLVASTAIIAFIDGFNPCSLWVLSVLLALSLRTGSRKRIFLVGLVFITVTAAVYALFIAGMFTMFTIVSFLGWIQVVVALVALSFALVNIKDYFWYKEGISFTIADEKKPGIYQRIRRVLNAGDSVWQVIGATVVLAVGVSLVEFSCTAGFPVLWTNLLISQEATALTFGLLLLFYMLIYQIDELGIFAVAVITLKANRFEESQGRVLKLIGGMLMMALAVVMLIDPALMSSLSTSLWVFVAAFAATIVVVLVHRAMLPRLGVYIGTGIRPPAAGRLVRRQKA
jgi:thiol-disulfide isomerase/thioredoxin